MQMYASAKHSRHAAVVFGVVTLLALVAAAGPLARGAGARQVRIGQFVDPLPIPALAQPVSVDPQTGVPTYHITMTQFEVKMARNLPPTTVWGYGGTVPGPVIAVTKGVPAIIRWDNELPTTPLLAIDHAIPGAEASLPDVRAVVHVHGMHVQPQFDGLPEQWFTPGHSLTDTYPNAQRAADLIYHDHAMGVTRLNVYAGLIGGYVIVDPAEAALGLPSGNFDVPLVIQDKTFDRNPASPKFGQLVYPATWVPEYFGDTIIVNGKAWPYENVAARKYRFRVWNGANDRFFDFRFSNGMTFWQIGTDGGLLAHPAKLRHLLLGPGERADLIVDFSAARGEKIVLTNSAKTPYPGGDRVTKDASKVMQFRVAKPKVADPSKLPATLSTDVPSAASMVATAVKTRDITLGEFPDLTHPDPTEVNGYEPEPQLEGLSYNDPVTITPKLGTTEVWRYVNTTGDTHPMHEHDVMNRIVARIPFNVAAYWFDKVIGQPKSLETYFTGPPQPANPNEDGWKDTVQCPPGYVTEVVMTFSDYVGSYVLHCHILSHEEHDMMRPFEVMP
jgi:spore coat protein A, manganese oxidase